MPTSPTACAGCGARLPADAERCDLCGTSASTADPAAFDAPEAELDEALAEAPADGPAPTETTAEARRFCVACGTENPAHARFCWSCGEALAGVEARPTPPPARPAAPRAPAPPAGRRVDPAGRHALFLLAAAAGVVVLLFALTQLVGSRTAPAEPAAASAAPPAEQPLPPEVAAQVARLEDQISAADDPAVRVRAQQDLVETLLRAGAFARAGEVQESIARATDAAAAWADAGSFYLAYMLRTEGPDRNEFARRSAYAYEQALERNPGDLDVKTDLATAYLNDPANPMQAVTVILEVLEADPDHARARFNYGLMLAQIGRVDQAREQFERVVDSTTDDDLVHERAAEELARLRALAG